jgi:hypothetical protein
VTGCRALIFANYIGPAMRDRHGQSLVPKYLDGSSGGVPSDAEQIYKIFF